MSKVTDKEINYTNASITVEESINGINFERSKKSSTK